MCVTAGNFPQQTRPQTEFERNRNLTEAEMRNWPNVLSSPVLSIKCSVRKIQSLPSLLLPVSKLSSRVVYGYPLLNWASIIPRIQCLPAECPYRVTQSPNQRSLFLWPALGPIVTDIITLWLSSWMAITFCNRNSSSFNWETKRLTFQKTNKQANILPLTKHIKLIF